MAHLIVRRDGPVGRIVFSNPDKLNALTLAMWEGFAPAVRQLDADPAVRVLVLQGQGERAFVSGADIQQFGPPGADPAALARFNQAVENAYNAPGLCSKPVVAQVRGVCMGGGLGLAAACDLRFCSEDSRFRMPAARLGLGYSVLGVQRFLATIGLQNTLDIFMSARVFDAHAALRMGFVSQVLPADGLAAAVDAWCAASADNAPLTLKALKLTAQQLLRDPSQRDLAAVQAAIEACNTSQDHLEGARAFLEKRTPVFCGR